MTATDFMPIRHTITRALYFFMLLVSYLLLTACSKSSSGSNNAVETCYRVSIAYQGANQTNNLCTTREHGRINGLGVSRFLKFTLPTSSDVSIQVSRISGLNRSDPDLYLYKNGVLEMAAENSSFNTERLNTSSLDQTPVAGEYVVELNEYYYSIAGKPGTPLTTLQTEQKSLPAGITATVASPCTSTKDKIVSGNISFDRVPHNGTSLDYTNTIQLPVQQAVVEVICNNLAYSQGITDSNGNYSLNFPVDQNSFVRVRAQLKQAGTPEWDISVVDNTASGEAVYVMDSSIITETVDHVLSLRADSGWTGSDYTLPRVAAPFAILDSIRKAKNLVLTQDPNTKFPLLKINWSVNNTTSRGDPDRGQIGTSFFSSKDNEIFLLGAKDNDTDEYDEHVIIHEWGHYFEHNFSRSDSIGGPHTGGDILDIRVAFGEGFGNAFSAMVLDDPIYLDVLGIDQAEGFFINIENNNCENPGWYSECSVQSILYDLYDFTSNEDALNLGFTPIYNVLVAEQKNTAAFTSLFSFIKPLKDQLSTEASAIDILVGAQNIDPILDIYGGSQLNNNPGNTSKLPVYQSY